MSPNPPNPPTRERILNYLEENRTASVQALSRVWGLTRADIRYHLNALLDEGQIELVSPDASQPARRGRPAQLFRLAAHASPDNLPELCGALLAALLDSLLPEERPPALRRLAERLADSVPSGSPIQRLNQAVLYLNQRGYRARWEAGPKGPRILLRACPYSVLLTDHTELCALDQALLERLAQMPLKQTARMDLVGGKSLACIFSNG